MSRNDQHHTCRNLTNGKERISHSQTLPQGMPPIKGQQKKISYPKRNKSDTGKRLLGSKCDDVPERNRDVIVDMNYSDRRRDQS